MPERKIKVAILLATFNGAPFVAKQIASLKENDTEFTLHWLDDHSTDNTREVVRATVASVGLDLCEWHQSDHIGFPGSFFQLLESAEADIYLFCDQDDIWQPGKVDATVMYLLPHIQSHMLCFSDPLIFEGDEPKNVRRAADLLGVKIYDVLKEKKCFLCNHWCGHTMGFTRPLRDLYLRHKDIAREYAFLHDWWIYIIARASGTVHMLSDVPTTLYRRHDNNFTASFYRARFAGMNRNRIVLAWRFQKMLRRVLARQAKGFIIASKTMPSGPKAERLLRVARMVAVLERRQSPVAVIRLVTSGVMIPYKDLAILLAIDCMCTNAEA